MRLMGWAHKHSGFEKSKLGLLNIRHSTKKKIYQWGSLGGHISTVVLKNANSDYPMSGTRPQNRYTRFCQWGSWAGHTSTVVFTNPNCGSLMMGTWLKKIYTGFCQWGSCAGHTDTIVLINVNWSSLTLDAWPQKIYTKVFNGVHGLGTPPQFTCIWNMTFGNLLTLDHFPGIV